MNKKIISSLAVVAVVAAVTVGGTLALFSSTRTSANNVIKAGKLVLSLDNTCHYDGMVCKKSTPVGGTEGYYWEEESDNSSTYDELIGEPCSCTWTNTEDASDKLLFSTADYGDLKPGDDGESTISFHVDNNPAWICAKLANVHDNDNECVTPETEAQDATCGDDQGELSQNMTFSAWLDNGAGANGVACDNVKNGDEADLSLDIDTTGKYFALVDKNHGGTPISAANDGKNCVGVKWGIDKNVGNIIQTDSLAADFAFTAVQYRHNEDFDCTDLNEPTEGTIIVKKVATKDGQPDTTTEFSFSGYDNFVLKGGEENSKSMLAGTYAIDESLPAGWVKDSVVCTSNIGDTETNTNIELDASETVTCVFNNSFNTPQPVCSVVSFVNPFTNVDGCTANWSTNGTPAYLGTFTWNILGGNGSVVAHSTNTPYELSQRGTKGLGVKSHYEVLSPDEIDSLNGKENIEVLLDAPMNLKMFQLRSLFNASGDNETAIVELYNGATLVYTYTLNGSGSGEVTEDNIDKTVNRIVYRVANSDIVSDFNLAKVEVCTIVP